VVKHLINEGLVNQKIGRVLVKHRECIQALCKIVLKLGKKGVKRLGRKTINVGSRGGKVRNEVKSNTSTSTPKKEEKEVLASDNNDSPVNSQLKTKEKNDETQWKRKSRKKGSYFPPYPEERYIKRATSKQIHNFVDVNTISTDEEDIQQGIEGNEQYTDIEEVDSQISAENKEYDDSEQGSKLNKSVRLHEVLIKYDNGLCTEPLYYRDINNFQYIVSTYDFRITGGNKLESFDFEHLHLMSVNGHKKTNRQSYVSNYLINTTAAI
jgi:hypothetical protein